MARDREPATAFSHGDRQRYALAWSLPAFGRR
jgi:hypothetical protein